MSSQKQFPATLKRLKRAKSEGQVLKARMLVQIISLVAGFIGLYLSLRFFWVGFHLLLKYIENPSVNGLTECFSSLVWIFIVPVVAVLGLASLGSIIMQFYQVGYLFSSKLFMPNMSRIGFISGVNKIFSGFKELPLRFLLQIFLLMLFIFKILGLLAVWQWAQIEIHVIRVMLAMVIKLIAWAASGFLCFAIIDFYFQRKRYLKGLSMSWQEIVNEQKENEGDSNWKAYRKSLHEQVLYQDLVKRIKKSKVIVVESA